ncbi:hypothetical protein KDL01_31930 [Actinospica durhamensis]|uniref:MFS transporter n=1 Tax=Actinospica durhamensis TaxID=1508375 RepID=A0A941EUJ3_9ACTN|nr:hypothetical protein [Actinospica durhamensis]MBR7837925.1 hypothetical protein [Actinospica durhamensis]
MTVMAGFASSIFLPLSGWLNDAYGWREAIAILAVAHRLVAIPLHLLERKSPDSQARARAQADEPMTVDDGTVIIRAAVRHWEFWLFAASFVVEACALVAVGVLRVAMPRALTRVRRDDGRSARRALRHRPAGEHRGDQAHVHRRDNRGGLPGPGTRRGDAPVHLDGSTNGVIACVPAFGRGLGVPTNARPALLAERYGTTAYATLSAAWVCR